MPLRAAAENSQSKGGTKVTKVFFSSISTTWTLLFSVKLWSGIEILTYHTSGTNIVGMFTAVCFILLYGQV